MICSQIDRLAVEVLFAMATTLLEVTIYSVVYTGRQNVLQEYPGVCVDIIIAWILQCGQVLC